MDVILDEVFGGCWILVDAGGYNLVDLENRRMASWMMFGGCWILPVVDVGGYWWTLQYVRTVVVVGEYWRILLVNVGGYQRMLVHVGACWWMLVDIGYCWRVLVWDVVGGCCWMLMLGVVDWTFGGLVGGCWWMWSNMDG